tara:strand:+ start:117 stop:380 length:264 start_codon:yes stop_codon:yes gene_type:complete
MALDTEKSIPAGEDVLTVTRSTEIGDDTKVAGEAPRDIGWDLYQAALLMDPIEREVIAKRVKLKLDFILLPLVSKQRVLIGLAVTKN